MTERRSSERMNDEAEQWFYDLGKLAQKVNNNYEQSRTLQQRANTYRKRVWALATFVVFAFLLLAWRSEVNADRISSSNQRITETQRASCEGGNVIITKFNAQQDALIAIERTNPFIDDKIRAARIKAYQDVKIEPLPICAVR